MFCEQPAEEQPVAMAEFDPAVHPHRRLNPLTNEYILVSPHRNNRPWLGQMEAPQSSNLPRYDPRCYLCPRNTRATGEENPDYLQTYAFQNDFSAILPPPSPSSPPTSHPLFHTHPVHGGCDVLVFHPRHDLTLARLSVPEIINIIDEWISIYRIRGLQRGVKYVQIFENKGSTMGCSNPHPHGQVWSLSEIPTIPTRELDSLLRFSLSEVSQSNAPVGPKGRPCLLCEYAYAELQVTVDGRVVTYNEHWMAVVPWWATWPYELLLLPHKRHIESLLHLTPAEKLSFAELLSNVTIRYDNLFSCSFPYSMGIHQRPVPVSYDVPSIEDNMNVAHLHVHFTPPLLRSADVKKFLVGFELMAEAQRDLTPEQAALRLRECSDKHYLDSCNLN